jgi:DNA-binding NarL/FixJ family response regulator
VNEVRVFHCDDSAPFRMLVREMLREQGERVHVVGEAASVDAALLALPDAAADVVLLDLLDSELEDDLVMRLRGVAPHARFVVYTGMPERQGVCADAHVHKSVPFEELHRVISEVAARA